MLKRYVVSALRNNTTYETLEAEVFPTAYKTVDEAKQFIDSLAKGFGENYKEDKSSSKCLKLVNDYDEADFVEFEYHEVVVAE